MSVARATRTWLRLRAPAGFLPTVPLFGSPAVRPTRIALHVHPRYADYAALRRAA
ncbi:MAG: hypothetical protein ABIJ48_00085 [Actinomycetota bacterium]